MSSAWTSAPSASAARSTALAVDGRSLNQLKYDSSKPNAESTREAAKQFESLFMREMIKSMREATMKSGLLDGAQGDLGTDLLDQQLSVEMSGRPGGLSEAIARQLMRQMGGAAQSGDDAGDNDADKTGGISFNLPSTLSLARSSATPWKNAAASPSTSTGNAQGRDAFVQAHSAAAERVAQQSGLPASFMLGQAGHETGWGKSNIKNSDGSDSHNLFGIKATGGWTGKVAEITTTEYEGGVPRKVTAKFRAYDSPEESFRDYARLINQNPRYEQARSQTGSAQAYAQALQNAGYATDPAYAQKLSGAIQSAVRGQLAARAGTST